MGQFSANLSNVQAGGGGDTPESVSAGLHDAIHLPGWADASGGRHLRMIVLVGDAPPHLDYPNDYEYTQLLREAVAAGIKIFPIGASGLDDQGEYIFRQFAEVTQGQFVFLTYANGVSGAPGPATDHHVSDFTVNNLDSLVVNLVAGEVAAQTGQQSQGANGGAVPMSVVDAAPVEGSGDGSVLASLEAAMQSVIRLVQSQDGMFWLVVLLVVAAVIGAARPSRRIRLAMPVPDLVVPESGAPPYSDEIERELESSQEMSLTDGDRAWLGPQKSGQHTIPLKRLPLTFGNVARQEAEAKKQVSCLPCSHTET